MEKLEILLEEAKEYLESIKNTKMSSSFYHHLYVEIKHAEDIINNKKLELVDDCYENLNNFVKYK